jgi:TRAP-type mannitol/chloroaromatic compound transport system permease small subunit
MRAVIGNFVGIAVNVKAWRFVGTVPGSNVAPAPDRRAEQRGICVLQRVVRVVDAVNERIGRAVAWLTLGCVLTCFAVVVLRYGFDVGYPWMQEFYVWQHAVVFLVGAGYTLLHRGHVNVDILYGRMSPRHKAWLDILGTLLFLFPWLAVVAWTSGPFVLASWAVREGSANPSGMPGIFLLKTTVWVFVLLVFAQGLAHAIRCGLLLAGREMADDDEAIVTDERV